MNIPIILSIVGEAWSKFFTAPMLSRDWCNNLIHLLPLGETSSLLPVYCILALAVVAAFLLFFTELKTAKAVVVVMMSVLETYYFGFYTGDAAWFYSQGVPLLSKIIAMFVITAVLTSQILLVMELTVLSNIQSGKIEEGSKVSVAMYMTIFFLFATSLITRFFSWIGFDTISNILGVIGIAYSIFFVCYSHNWSKGNKKYAIVNVLVCLICISSFVYVASNIFWTVAIATMFSIVPITFCLEGKYTLLAMEKRASHGDTKCMCALAKHYQGEGDNTKALEYIRMAIDHEDSQGYVLLAKCYIYGKGVSVDFEKARKIGQKLSDIGSTAGQNVIGEALHKEGLAYAKGRGVVKDEIKANQLFLQAGECGYAEGYDSLAYSYYIGRGLEANGDKFYEYATKAFEMGDMDVCSMLGAYYRNGQFVSIDHAKGHEWDMQGAKAGEVICQIRVANDFYSGTGTIRNDSEAAKWYKKVADNEKASQKDRGFASFRYAMIAGRTNMEEGKQYIRQAQRFGDRTALEEGNDFLKL